MMLNLAEKLEEVGMSTVMDKDFMATIRFSIIWIPQYTNIVKIVMNGPVLERAYLINELTAIE
jgi:hypothetical protein